MTRESDVRWWCRFALKPRNRGSDTPVVSQDQPGGPFLGLELSMDAKALRELCAILMQERIEFGWRKAPE